MIVLLVAAAIVRLLDLSDWWLNPDEGIYYSALTRSDFVGFWRDVVENAHPPLYYLLLRGFSFVTWDFYWLRVFSVLCGLAAIWGTWAASRELAGGSGPRAVAAGLLAALILAFAPGAVALSQVMRPYMLQLALLAWALYFWLRILRTSARRDVWAYVILICLALLTHYSSVLALGVFVAAGATASWADGAEAPTPKQVAAIHLVPIGLMTILYVLHLRTLADSALANEALQGWLVPYMVDRPADAWLAFLGFQHLVALPWLRGPMALLLLAAVAVGAFRREHAVWTFAGGALAVGLVAATLGLHPFGSTRHSTWALAFTVPALGWLGGTLLEAILRGSNGFSSPRALAGRRVVPLLLTALVLGLGGPVGSTLGMDRAPWAPTDRVLRRADIARMLEVLEPTSEPELMLMSAQTFYLLTPFYATHRDRATYSSDSTAFHFPYGTRRVLVSAAWDFTVEGAAGSDPPPPGGLGGFLETVDGSFPGLAVTERNRAVLLVGGWRPPFVDRLRTAAREHPFIHSVLSVPGLYAFAVDPGRMAEALDRVRGGRSGP